MDEKKKKEEVILTFVKEQNLEAFVNILIDFAENSNLVIRANKSAHIEIVRKNND
jgi:hypothetical protein